MNATPENDRADVLIVGGGPSGSTVARSLVGRGFDVVVVDRATFPRDKVCAGWITPAVVELLELDLANYGREHVLQPIHGFRAGLVGRERLTGFEREPISYGIRRCEFDHYLLASSGARTSLGESVRSIERVGGEWVLNDRWRAPLLVGAGGHGCPVARLLNPEERGRTVVAAQEIEPALSEEESSATNVDPAVPLLSFCEDLAGYGWAFRKGRYLNVGLGREGGRGLNQHVAAYAALLAGRGEIPRSLTDSFRGHAYLLYSHPPRRIATNGALLVGDAAGLAHPKSGEGIRPAIESGLLAAELLAEALTSASGAVERLDPIYPERLGKCFGQRRPADVSSWLPGPARRALASTLLGTTWFNRRVVVDSWFLQRGRRGAETTRAPAPAPAASR